MGSTETPEGKIKVLQVSMWDLTGHVFNGHDLTESLNTDDRFSASMLVLYKQSSNEFVGRICNRLGLLGLRMIKYLERLLSMQNVLSPVYWFLKRNKTVIESNIVHLQLIHFGFFGLGMIQKLSQKKRVIWTLHDLWAITGHCIHPKYADCDRWKTGCGKCPDLSVPFPLFFDTTKALKARKMRIFARLDIDIVVGSAMMMDLVRQSGAFPKARIHRIPFGVRTDVFRPLVSSELRQIHGIPATDFVMMFRVDRGKFKGTVHIKQMLGILELSNVTLIAVGERGILDGFRDRYNVLEFDWIHDDAILSELYNLSDVFVMPSRAESFGLMAVEAMACKTTVVAFANTALLEILSGDSGVLVADGSSKALAKAITELCSNPEKRREIAERGYTKVLNEYRYAMWVEQMKRLYASNLPIEKSAVGTSL